MYQLVTQYALFGLRLESDPVSHTPHQMLRPVAGAPPAFDTEADALAWARHNHDELRHHPRFVVLPVHHLVLADAS
ncbi:MAG TPA: hypothetical protein VF629_19535 [Hymenobacter sp.]|jgi:hypothetical protein|uniref:hypothetical protein n=1 Tax=Hymenobacter sp. TaxID=1898978 RepID=UPI002ED853AB